MYTTLRECLEDPDWEKALEIIKRNSKFMTENWCYDDK